MTPTRKGSIRLFRLGGIDVFLHWSWFIVALIQVQDPINHYSSYVWNVLEYLALFGIVLLHEFGHAFACRQVGGRANQIVLWPLGGVAYVAPPPRPGAMLWSIAAGPLVNVVLMPVTFLLVTFSSMMGWSENLPDVDKFLTAMFAINTLLLVFNLLPIYPLDGGQVLRSLLWFFLGRGRSLMAASVVGLIGVIGLLALAAFQHSIWPWIMAAFVLLNCWVGFVQARLLIRVAKAPRRAGFSCPSCKAEPPVGDFWACQRCRVLFDTFAALATCPKCQSNFDITVCLECGTASAFSAWSSVLPPFSLSAPPPLRAS